MKEYSVETMLSVVIPSAHPRPLAESPPSSCLETSVTGWGQGSKVFSVFILYNIEFLKQSPEDIAAFSKLYSPRARRE